MVSADKILKQALKKIRPSPEEKRQMKKALDNIIDISKPIAKKFNARPMICGSSIKNTWLAGRNEFDLFILFPKSLPKTKLKDYGLAVGKEIIESLKGKYVIAYAEHPYLRGKLRYEGTDYDIDIVPAFDVKDPTKIKSSVDRTPHHVDFVKKNMQLSDEARLLKGFTKGIRVYGADVKTQGFSGYLCELLSINYGRFKNCIKDAATWRAPIVISINTKIKKEEAYKKFKAPLIVIDPVDPNRNVAAAVSVESFYNFVSGCKDFLKNPSSKYFFPDRIKPYTLSEISKEIRKRGTRWYMIKFKRPDVIDDTLWPQLRRSLNTIEKKLEESGFRTIRKDAWADDKLCVLAFETDIWLVPRIMKNIGPNVYSKHAENFLKHYNEYKIFIEGDNWVVEKEREFITAYDLLKHLLKGSAEDLKKRGIPSKLTENMTKSRVISGPDVVRSIGDLPVEFRVFMKEWFERDIDLQ